MLINYTAFIESLAVAASVGALLWLRYTQPNLERPIKVNLLLPIVFFITCLFLVLLPFYVSPYETGIGVAITLTGVPIYFLTVQWKSKPRLYNKLISKCCHFSSPIPVILALLVLPFHDFFLFPQQTPSPPSRKSFSSVLKRTSHQLLDWTATPLCLCQFSPSFAFMLSSQFSTFAFPFTILFLVLWVQT